MSTSRHVGLLLMLASFGVGPVASAANSWTVPAP